MNLEIQKFYRFILPGALLLASNYNTIKILLGFNLAGLKDVNLYVLFLGISAILIGVPLYWVYIVGWHFLFEKKDMQKLQVQWLNAKIPLTNENIDNYSNLIWHYMDSGKDYESVSNWLRNNFLLIHSLGCSAIALVVGFVFYLWIKGCSFFDEKESLFWILWLILFICILFYRSELRNRYLKRLEIFIKVNSVEICNVSKKFESHE